MASFKTLIFAIALSFTLALSGAIAQVSISLPENGTYRAGQFMLVHVDAKGLATDGTITLAARGALTTAIAMGGQSQANVPVLMLTDDAARLSWSLNGSAPRELDAPLVASRGDDAADRALAGPNSSIGGPDVYAPTFGWSPGASARVRRMSILMGMLVAILLLACPLLLRGRIAVVGTFLVVTLSVTCIVIGRRYVSPIWRAEGEIVVVGADGVAQFDAWQYVTARTAAKTALELPVGARPVFVNAQQARDVQASLHFDVERQILSLRCELQPRMKVAVLLRRTTRSVSPPPSTQPMARAIRSPMGEIASRVYVNSQTRVVDEGSVAWVDDQLVHWPSVILWRER